MDLEIIDNFLPEENFNTIKLNLLGEYFPWYYNDSTLNPRIVGWKNDKGPPQFTHTFYCARMRGGICSDFYSLFDQLLNQLNVGNLLRIKANLNPRTVFKRNTGYHFDTENVRTALLYVNTNTGGTKFKDGKFIKSVENRMVIFDSNMVHAGITCTKGRRVLANFNFKYR